MHISLLKYTET